MLLLVTILMLYPFARSAYLSFTDFKGIGDPEWVGLDNYRTLLKDPVAFTDVLHKIPTRWERSVTIVTVPHGPAVPRPDYTHIPSQTPGSSIVKHYPKHEDNQNGLHVTQRVGLYNPKDLHDVIVQIKNP